MSDGGAWALKLDRRAVRAAATLRPYGGVRGCITEDALWLRGDALTPELDLNLRKTGGERYAVSTDARLTRVGQLLPCGALPDGPWAPLGPMLRVDVPTPALPGFAPAPVALRLSRDTRDRPATILVTTTDRWAAWAECAGAVRLAALRFAVDARGRVLVRGEPLPPLAGVRYVESAGVALPCGWDFEPRVPAAVVAQLIRLGPADVALFDEHATYELIEAASFVAALRAAVRATAGRLRTREAP